MGDLIEMLTKLSKLNQQGDIDDMTMEDISSKLDQKLQKLIGPIAYHLLYDSLNHEEE